MPKHRESPPKAPPKKKSIAKKPATKKQKTSISFDPRKLDKTLIALALLEQIKDARGRGDLHHVIIDLNLEYPGGREAAKDWVTDWLTRRMKDVKVAGERIDGSKSLYSQQYVYVTLTGDAILALAEDVAAKPAETPEADARNGGKPAIYKIWLDFPLKYHTNRSVRTVKADAARASFDATGEDIVWAVADSGVDKTHPHFARYNNLVPPDPLNHRDFTGSAPPAEFANASEEVRLREAACFDALGHGTHVAGIIAGELDVTKFSIRAVVRELRGEDVETQRAQVETISGMAPRCKILSLKVLDDTGEGLSSNLIAAIEYIQHLNGEGRRIRVHGLNISVGYTFKPEWFACGQSPLCVEINRLARSGVSVVVAAGNDGYGYVQSQSNSGAPAGLDVTINDPGNADLAITVGSTHRDMPHVYGVSYFSSKGPTGDGRLKPDLVAPGEKIISCTSAQMARKPTLDDAAAPPPGPLPYADYRDDSGTSMAAPHVSGVIAAFLSIRREFIGAPETVKEIFLSSATDLKRAVYFQGKGLVDLMRAIQSI